MIAPEREGCQINRWPGRSVTPPGVRLENRAQPRPDLNALARRAVPRTKPAYTRPHKPFLGICRRSWRPFKKRELCRSFRQFEPTSGAPRACPHNIDSRCVELCNHFFLKSFEIPSVCLHGTSSNRIESAGGAGFFFKRVPCPRLPLAHHAPTFSRETAATTVSKIKKRDRWACCCLRESMHPPPKRSLQTVLSRNIPTRPSLPARPHPSRSPTKRRIGLPRQRGRKKAQTRGPLICASNESSPSCRAAQGSASIASDKTFRQAVFANTPRCRPCLSRPPSVYLARECFDQQPERTWAEFRPPNMACIASTHASPTDAWHHPLVRTAQQLRPPTQTRVVPQPLKSAVPVTPHPTHTKIERFDLGRTAAVH